MRNTPLTAKEDSRVWPFARDQRIVGGGFPAALQSNMASSPSVTVSELGDTEITGALPAANESVKENLEWIQLAIVR